MEEINSSLKIDEEAQQIENWFVSHPPFGDQSHRYELVRQAGKELTFALCLDEGRYEDAWHSMQKTILENCPDSIERDYALKHLGSLEEPSCLDDPELLMQILRFQVVMPANAAIACNEKMIERSQFYMNENSTTWNSHHWETEGKPDGGQSYGIGFCIAWQRGSLQDEGRNGAFLTEILDNCLIKLRNPDVYISLSWGIGYTIAWADHSLGDILAACLDELKHKDRWFPCIENTQAIDELTHCLKAQGEERVNHLARSLELLNSRVKRREKAGTYGTHIPDPPSGAIGS
jgi:hypothetical protein